MKNKKYFDYKQQGREYERFGNYNFGAMMGALGVPKILTKSAAGYAQWRAGTAKSKWIMTFGDDPKDQWDIERGYEYATK